MSIKTKIVAAALAAAVVLTAGAAMASTIKYDTKLYANPGYGTIGWVHGGQWVDVHGCDQGYCFVHKPGADGFVKASAIWFDQGYDYNWWYHNHPFHGGYGGYPHGVFPHGPGFGGPGFCAGGPGGSFCIHP